MQIQYPSKEKIVEFNIFSLNFIKAKKADESKVLSALKIDDIIKECKITKSDIYDKAVVLFKGLIQKHPFASGNRRTALITTKDFILKNKGYFRIQDKEDQANVLQGIRENYYSDDEIKGWIKNGKIKEFKRF